MEIYHRKARWLGLIFGLPALWLALSIAGYTSFSIGSRDTVAAYIVIVVCSLMALLCFFGSTQFYFDNSIKAGIQTRKHFYGEKILLYPYDNIIDVTIRCYKRGNNGTPKYCVGITEQTEAFNQKSVKFTELRAFGGSKLELAAAYEFAKQISDYTKLRFFDDSDSVRAQVDH